MPDYDEFERLRQYYDTHPPEFVNRMITEHISMTLDCIREDHETLISNLQSNNAIHIYEYTIAMGYRLIAMALGLENRAAAKTLYDGLHATILQMQN